MINVLLDTNVILDAVANRVPFNKNAEQIFILAAEQKIKGYITANSLTDIYYIAKKQLEVDYIITRDDIFLKSGKNVKNIEIIEPLDFLEIFA